MSQLVEILLDGESILDKVKSLRIERRNDQAVDVLTLELADYSLYAEFDFGALPAAPRVEVLTGTALAPVSQGKFFIEKPDVAEDKNSLAIPSLWGRSALARLLDPFAPTISRTWKVATTFYAVCRELVREAGMDDTQIVFDIDDYQIPQDVLSVTGQYPLQVITDLAGKTNGYVRNDKSGNLWIKRERFHFDALPIAQALGDDDVQESRTRVEYPEFGNRILIRSSVASATQPIRVSIRAPESCLRGDGKASMIVEAVVVDQDGDPVADGTSVFFSIDNAGLALFLPPIAFTGEKVIISEPQRSSGLSSLSVDYPIGRVVGVFLEDDFTKDDNLFVGGTVEGTGIELTEELPFTDTRLVVDYVAKGIARTTLRTVAGAAEQETEIHAAVGKMRDSVSFCINNQRNISIKLDANVKEHNLCRAGEYKSTITAQVMIDGAPGAGAMVQWLVAGTGAVAPLYSPVASAVIANEAGRALSVSEVGTKNDITAVLGVWLYESGKGGTNFFTNKQKRQPSFVDNKITLGTDLPSDDAQVLIDYKAEGMASVVFTALAVVGKSTITARLNDGTATPVEEEIEIEVVNRCTDAGNAAGAPLGGKKDCSQSAGAAVGCGAGTYPNAIDATKEECICKAESFGSPCPTTKEGCDDLCAKLYDKYGLDPLSCETRVTETQRKLLETQLGRDIPADKANAYRDCANECKDNQGPACLDPCVKNHKKATTERCSTTCKDHGVIISPATGSIACGGAKSLSFTVKGGKGPYSWGASVGSIKPSADGASATLTPPANTGGFAGQIAYSLFGHKGGWALGPGGLTGGPGGGPDVIDCVGILANGQVNFGCDGIQVGAGVSVHGNGPQICCDSPIVTAGCQPGGNANVDIVIAATGAGELRDVRTAPMLAGNCNPCRVAIGQGGTVTVTDSQGVSATAVVTA